MSARPATGKRLPDFSRNLIFALPDRYNLTVPSNRRSLIRAARLSPFRALRAWDAGGADHGSGTSGAWTCFGHGGRRCCAGR